MAASTDSASHSSDGRRNLSSPTHWAHIVRGESEVVQAAPSSSSPVNSDCSPAADVKPASSPLPSDDSSSAPEASEKDNSGVSGAKKPSAWNKLANGTIKLALSWRLFLGLLSPSPLGLCQNHSPILQTLSPHTRFPSIYLLLYLSCAFFLQGALIASSPNKQVITDANPNSIPNHAFSVRQKSIRSGSGGGPASAVSTKPPPSTVEVPRNNSANPGAATPRDPSHKTQNWDGEQPRGGGFAQRVNIANDHPHPHPYPRGSSFRRGNGGPHPPGDGS